MAKQHSFSNNRPQPWQNMVGGFVFVVLFIGSILLVAFSRSDNMSLNGIQQKISGFIAPIGEFISSPIETTTHTVDRVQQTISNTANAERLAAENKILLQWKLRAEKLQAENDALSRLLKLVPVMNSTDLTARILGNVAGPYSHQLQIAAGTQNGVKEGMTVVDSNGFVGRIISAGSNVSQLLMITDMNSRVAVVTGKSREHAVVKGQGEGRLGLYYLPEDTKIKVGEKLYTSGDGNLIAEGLLVGTVSDITGSAISVVPAIDIARLDYVRLLLAKE